MKRKRTSVTSPNRIDDFGYDLYDAAEEMALQRLRVDDYMSCESTDEDDWE